MNTGLHIGLLINPVAGIGGSLALKGSDGAAVRHIAAAMPSPHESRSQARGARALTVLSDQAHLFRVSCWGGVMGETALQQSGLAYQVLGASSAELSSSEDTQQAAAAMLRADVDLIVFVGGDGTARDIYDVVAQSCPTLGIPAGVKMHSGVFAVSPEAAAELLLQLALGKLVGVQRQEVRDIDEEAFRQDVIRSRFYGELLVPGDGSYLQNTKVGGREDTELVAADIAAWQVENMKPDCTYVIGPGSTTAAIMAELDLSNTLLGVDVVRNGNLLASDANEEQLLKLLVASASPATIIVTAIGGQGYIFGRGNQQLSPAVIRAVGVDNITVISAKSKLAGLQGRPLLVDTNDSVLDAELCGYRTVTTGYQDQVLYRVSSG